jgi:hypothetical protein
MAVIEIVTFRLAPGQDEAAFLEADLTAQTEFFYRQPGIIRRTLARGPEDEWLALTLWSSSDAAAAAAEASHDDHNVAPALACIDRSSVTAKSYAALD